jgi:inhibitor of KinA sporulation pathway (predicted exonuclease)
VAKKLDHILVVDVEATCWDGEPPPGQESEIIEIGVCVLEVTTGQRSHKQSMLVRPERSQVSAYCTQLTSLTQEQVERGLTFHAACTLLQNHYSSKSRVWASYGDYDRRQFEQQCASFNVDYPFGHTHINIKNLFALSRGLREEVGMAKALELLQRPLEGTPHRAGDDAWNIAGILAELLLKLRSRS